MGPTLRLLLFSVLSLHGLSTVAQAPPAATQDIFPGVTTTPTAAPFSGVAPKSIQTTPLAALPSVLALDHLQPAQMSDRDHEIVANLSPELSRQAALANFDISSPQWQYQQIQCPAFPDYVFLSFHHGPDTDGSSHFVAALPRNSAEVRLVSTYAHGLLPFESSWDRPGSFEVFNGVLRQERGSDPLSDAPNWLLIAVCYAEFTGYPVQVLSATPNPGPTLDLLRLEANQPEMLVHADQSADITFSDVSRPGATSHWRLHFDRRGQITHVAQSSTRQPPAIALKP